MPKKQVFSVRKYIEYVCFVKGITYKEAVTIVDSEQWPFRLDGKTRQDMNEDENFLVHNAWMIEVEDDE